MKKNISRIVVFASCLPLFCACGTFLEVAGSIVGQAAATAVAPMIQSTYEQQGMSKEDAKNQTKDFLEYFGANTSNIETGLSYMENHDKAALISNATHDALVNGMRNANLDPALKEKLGNVLEASRQGVNAFNEYNKNSNASQTFQDKQAAEKALFDNCFNAAATAYQRNEAIRRQQREEQEEMERLERERQKEMAMAVNMPEILSDNGLSQDYSDEICNTILAVQESNDMNSQEKESFYQSIGINKSAAEIDAIVAEIKRNNSVSSKTTEKVNVSIDEQQADMQKKAETRAQTLNSINTLDIDKFSFDCTELSENQKSELDAIISVLNEYPDAQLTITGHTCSIGTKTANEHVGLRRAESAKSYLIEKGISAERISTISAGDAEPVADNSTSDNRKLNRRLQFNIK